MLMEWRPRIPAFVGSNLKDKATWNTEREGHHSKLALKPSVYHLSLVKWETEALGCIYHYVGNKLDIFLCGVILFPSHTENTVQHPNTR